MGLFENKTEIPKLITHCAFKEIDEDFGKIFFGKLTMFKIGDTVSLSGKIFEIKREIYLLEEGCVLYSIENIKTNS